MALAETAFAKFWEEYPRKVKKKKAREKFIEQRCHEKMDLILPALRQQKQTAQWLDNDGAYVPHPATWIYNEQWEDDVDIDVEPTSDRQEFTGYTEDDD